MSDDWVVRAGISDPTRLMAGYGRHMGHLNEQIYGFSVQYQPGLSVDDLARAGGFPNKQIAYAQKADLEAVLRPLGHTLIVVYEASKIMLKVLPADAAQAISAALHRKPNPYAVNP